MSEVPLYRPADEVVKGSARRCAREPRQEHFPQRYLPRSNALKPNSPQRGISVFKWWQLPGKVQLLYINVQWYPSELVFEAHRLLYHST